MSVLGKRILAPALVLAALLLGLFGLSSVRRVEAPAPGGVENHAPEAVALTQAEEETYRFFQEDRAVPGAGRGLFETDFFKTKPVPAKVEPPAPTRREAVLFYRGLATFSDGGRVAYLTIDGRSATLASDEVVIDGWKLDRFDGERATLKKGTESVDLPFNRRAVVSVPIKP